MNFPRLVILSLAICAWTLAAPVDAVQVEIRIENVAPADSVATSPFFIAAHDGSFDAFDVSTMASLGIENVAELGDGTDLDSEATTASPTAVTGSVLATNGGFNGAIFTPGSSGSIILDLDPSIHRYLTYGAMVVPSNDAFFGNDSPTQVELFDPNGNFVAADFTLTGGNVWDAGTEVNQLTGSAYVVGQSATDGTTEGNNIALADLNALFGIYVGAQTPPGPTFGTVPGSATPISSFSFSVVPEPSTMVMAVAAATVLFLPRKRR